MNLALSIAINILLCKFLFADVSVKTHMTSKARSLILHGHNLRRALIASGMVEDFDCSTLKKAKRMSKLTYNCLLEQSAKQWAEKCEWKHSTGKQGENLYYISKTFPIEEVVPMALKAWWDDEFNKVSERLPKVLTPDFMSRTNAGHFTQMSTDLIQEVGCAATVCPSGSGELSGALYFVCHYDRRQLIQRPIYSSGKTCSGCSHCEKTSGLCVHSRSHRQTNKKQDKNCKVKKEKDAKIKHKFKHPMCKKRSTKKGARKHRKNNREYRKYQN